MARFFYVCCREVQMHYPLNVYLGKIREYAGSRPSAIAKYQVDGELKLTELGLEGDQQAETTGGEGAEG